MPTSTSVRPSPPVIRSETEQIAEYLRDHRKVLLNGSETAESLCSHLSISRSRLRSALLALDELLEPLKLAVCQREQRNGWVLRVTSDAAIYAASTLRRRRAIRTELARMAARMRALDPTQARELDDMVVLLESQITSIEADLEAASK